MIDDLVAGLSDPDPEIRRKAVFGVLSHRRHDLLPMLYELALREQDGGLAVLATQAALTLRANPPDPQQESIIEKALSEKDGHNRLGPTAWEYLATSGNRRHRLHLLAVLAKSAKPPRQVWGFLTSCLGHCDPDVRMAACKPAVATGYGRLVAWVLATIEDPDAGVGRAAFAAVETAPRPLLIEALDEALDDSDEWVPSAVAPFLPVFAGEDMREMLRRGRENPLPPVAAKCREALGRLDARKAAAKHLPPPPPIPSAAAGPVLQLHVPVAAPVPGQPRISVAPPPGPLPWAHLVTPSPPPPAPQLRSTTSPAAASPAEPGPKPPIAPVAVACVPAPSPVPPVPTVPPTEPAAVLPPSQAPQPLPAAACPSPITPPAGRGAVKKERVISMRGKISSETDRAKPAAPPALSPEEQAAMFFGGAKPAPSVAIGGLSETAPTSPGGDELTASPIPEKPSDPPSGSSSAPPVAPESSPGQKVENISKDVKQEADEAALALLEAVPIDLVAALEEAPAVSARPLQDGPAPAELPPLAIRETKPEPVEPRLAVDLPVGIPAPSSPTIESAPSPEPPPAAPLPPVRADAPPIPSVPAPIAGAIELPRSQMITSILERYPSFVAEPLGRLFEPADAASLLKALKALLEPLTAFLSFTFMQTYLFFTPRNPKGDQVVKDALKAHLSGPNAVRFLHHLSLLIKGASGDGFFTVALAKAMSESSADTNPLFVLREISEFLQTPPDEAADGLTQVAEVLPPLLTSFKGILHNPIVLRLPPGAREPFLNLSGPKPAPLAPADRPGLDLPPNELILLSKDRSEALGLFPYFTFDGQRVVFRAPAEAEFQTLLERLELTL